MLAREVKHGLKALRIISDYQGTGPNLLQLISLNGENRMETQIFVPHNPQEAANIQALADYLSSIYYGN